MGATLPGAICTIACLAHEATAFHGHHEAMSGMDPCHAGYGVTASQPHANLSLEALPSKVRLALQWNVRLSGLPTFWAAQLTVYSEIATPPPRIG
jgi:hypothetical protein